MLFNRGDPHLCFLVLLFFAIFAMIESNNTTDPCYIYVLVFQLSNFDVHFALKLELCAY